MAVLSFTDQSTLANDSTFGNRVLQALVTAALAIQSEGLTTAQHSARVQLAYNILNNAPPGGYQSLFVKAIATDATVGAQAGSPPVQGNVTDAAISAMVSATWNAFACRGPQGA